MGITLRRRCVANNNFFKACRLAGHSIWSWFATVQHHASQTRSSRTEMGWTLKGWNSWNPLTEHGAYHISNIYLGDECFWASVCVRAWLVAQLAVRSVASRSNTFWHTLLHVRRGANIKERCALTRWVCCKQTHFRSEWRTKPLWKVATANMSAKLKDASAG